MILIAVENKKQHFLFLERILIVKYQAIRKETNVAHKITYFKSYKHHLLMYKYRLNPIDIKGNNLIIKII